MDGKEFRDTVADAVKYMAFYKKEVVTFQEPIEVEYGFNGEKKLVIPTVCYVEAPEECYNNSKDVKRYANWVRKL